MEWNFELTTQQARELYARAARMNKAGSRLLKAVGALVLGMALWIAAQAAQALLPGPGPFRPAADPVAGTVYAAIALGMAVVAVWVFLRSRPEGMADAALLQMERQGRPAAGRWQVRLDENQLLVSCGGAQSAEDPSVIQKATPCPEGLILSLHNGARTMVMPAAAFESPEAMAAAAAEFQRCSALAKARLLQRQAGELADPADRPALPPCPPLPQGESQVFAVPVMLQKEEVFDAYLAANQALHLVGRRRIVLAWVLLVVASVELVFSAAIGEWSFALLMACFVLLALLRILSRSRACQKNALRQQLAGEQLQRLTTPGWVVLGQSGYTATSGALCSYRPYARLNEVAQDERYLFLRFEGNMVSLIPKRGFESPEQARAAFDFLRERLGQKRGR